MDREELQSRRAYNQIWNGAGRYDLHPEEAAFDDQGDAELYINTIMGLAYGLYDFSRFQPMLHSFQLQQKGGLYTDVFWLGMEHAVFARARKARPALAGLRREYAQRTLARPHPQDPRESAESLRAAWARRVLTGEEFQDPWLRQVLAALEFDPGWNEQKIIDRTEELLFTFFRRARRSVTDRQWAAFAGRSIVGKGGGVRLIRPNALRALGRGDPSESGGVGAGKTMRLLSFLQGKTPEPILRRYVEDCFGTSMLTPSQLAEAERELCTGVHRNCRLHFTRGTPPEHPVSADAAWDAENFRRQREKNRAYYQKNLLQNRLTIAQLTQKLQNTLLLQQDEDTSLGRVGRLRGDVAWRAAALGEQRIFTRRSDSQPGELSVDILLDGSASRLHCQETIAAQGYILAKSLTDCGIPVRVSSFCSLRGYTVLRVLKDFGEKNGERKIFDYFAAGWNRDGLALRMAAELLNTAPADKHLLILLTDASPDDSHKILPTGKVPLSRDYDGQVGVEDTADEVRALRRKGIRVAAVFMGENANVPNARAIYGQDLAPIRRMDQLSAAAGRLIQTEIRELSG